MTDRPATYSEVFAVPAFRVLFVSRSLAISGGTLRIVALTMLVFSTTGSALLSAITFGIGFLPQVVGGMFLASLTDRLRPRRLIAAGYLLEAAVALLLTTANLSVVASLGLVALTAVLTPIFNGASSRLIAEVLTGDSYVLGRSLSTISAGAAQLAGMAFGGLAVAAVGPRRALLISVACQLLAALIVRLGLPNLNRRVVLSQRSAVGQTWSTNIALLRDRAILRLLLVQWLPPAFVVGAEGLIVAYAARRGFPAGAAGLMLAAAPGGMLVGDLVVGRFVRPSIRTRLVAPLIALLGIPLILLAANPPLSVAVALVAASCCGFAYMLGLQQAFLDAVPEANRGQAFSLLGTGLMTLQGLGPVVIGAIGQVAGARLAMAVAGAAVVLTAAVWAGMPKASSTAAASSADVHDLGHR